MKQLPSLRADASLFRSKLAAARHPEGCVMLAKNRHYSLKNQLSYSSKRQFENPLDDLLE
jgi:hypothetical protein